MQHFTELIQEYQMVNFTPSNNSMRILSGMKERVSKNKDEIETLEKITIHDRILHQESIKGDRRTEEMNQIFQRGIKSFQKASSPMHTRT